MVLVRMSRMIRIRQRKVALDMWLITLRNVITPYGVIRPASRGVLCWLPNVSTVTVFDDGPVTRASWPMILNLQSGLILLLCDSSTTKQQSSYLAFKRTVFQIMQSLLYTVFQTIAGIAQCTDISPVYEQWCDNWSNRISFCGNNNVRGFESCRYVSVRKAGTLLSSSEFCGIS